MKQTKLEKGITLIALIITIIVLLILAVVAIASVQESDIIKKSQEATKTYKEKEEEEKQKLQEYVDFMRENMPEDSKVEEVADEDVIEILLKKQTNQITEAVAAEQLRELFSIEDDSVGFYDMFAIFAVGNDMGAYCYETDKFYKAELAGYTVTDIAYVPNNDDYKALYKKGQTFKDIITALETAFVGESADEVIAKYEKNNGELETFIKTKVPKITDMTLTMSTDRDQLAFNKLTWTAGEYVLTITELDQPIPQTVVLKIGADGKFNKVMITNN